FPGQIDQLLLFLRDGTRDLRKGVDETRRNGNDAVPVPMDQIAGLDGEMAYLYGFAILNHVDVSTRSRQSPRKHLQSAGFNSRQLPRGPIGDRSYTAEGNQDMGVDLAEERPGAGRVIDVLHHQNSRSRNAADVFPPVGALLVPGADHRRIRGSNFACGGIAHHGTQILKETTKAGRRNSFIAQSDAEALDGVNEDTRVDGFEFLDLPGV